MRTNVFLEQRLSYIQKQYFTDITWSNQIIIRFGQKSRRRLGSICLKKYPRFPKKISLITLSGYLRSETIPEKIIDITIAHELVHYCHGFNSSLPRLFRYPHQGGVVDKELKKRGLAAELRWQKSWLKQKWSKTVNHK